MSDAQIDSGAVVAQGGVPQEKIFTVKKWNGVALWSWDIPVDNCAICRNHTMDPCIECQSQQNTADGNCILGWGQCNHAFHLHCITRWLKSR